MTTRQINNLLKNKQIDLYVRGNFGREYKTKLKKIEIDNHRGNYFIYCVYDWEYMDNMAELRVCWVNKERLLEYVESHIKLKNYLDLTKE